METKKVINILSIIKKILAKQNEIGTKTLSFIDGGFHIDRFKFESEISQNSSKEIVSLCNEITELNKLQPAFIDFDMIYYYASGADFSECFVLQKKDKAGWYVIDGIFDSKFSNEYNKKCLKYMRLTMKFDENATMANENLISFTNGILEVCNKQPKEQRMLTAALSKEKLTDIFNLLKPNYIDKKTTLDNWLHWFGKKTVENPKKIKWVGADSTLSNVVYQICNTSSEDAIKSAFDFKEKYQKPTTKEYKTGYLWNDINEILKNPESNLD